jgi:hypothetical protein
MRVKQNWGMNMNTAGNEVEFQGLERLEYLN